MSGEEPKNVPAVATDAPHTMAAKATANMWGWFQQASEQAMVVKNLAQEKAAVLAQQASELRQQYDMQVASEMLMSGIGAVPASLGRQTGAGVPSGKAQQETPPDVHYITENILTMSFPYSAKTKPRGLKEWNDINKVAHLLKQKHNGRYMIWNVSEDLYDYTLFENQVLEYKFPGHPSPPLGLLFKICAAIESWLDADRNNVAVVHCLTGKGRTGAILACVLAWIGEFSSPLEALSYVASRRGVTVEELTIPSQRRYVQYFSNVLDGVKPRSDPLLLRRVIMNTIPRLGTSKDGSFEGCCPYLQIFKNGTLIANSYIPAKGSKAGTAEEATKKSGPVELKWIGTSEGNLSFHMDVMIHGDVLIRCRHMDLNNGNRESMFRAAFHTGYTPIGVLRLTKSQLDGCDTDDRFDDDFFVDFIFAPVEKKDTNGKNVPLSNESFNESVSSVSSNAADKTAGSVASDSGVVVDSEIASKFDEMLHRDGRFWDKIAMRKNRATSNDSKKRKSRKFATSSNETFSIGDEGDANASRKIFANMYDDSKFLVDEKSAAAGSVPTTTRKDSSDLSDMELILQLAQAEEEDCSSISQIVEVDDEPAVSASEPSSAVPDSVTCHKKSGSIDAADEFLESLNEDLATPGDVVNHDNQGSDSKNELMALEDFERELGLMAPTTTTAPKDPTNDSVDPANSVDDFDDNLDELEKYLQSLGNS